MSVLPENFTLPEVNSRNEAWFTSGTLAVQACVDCDVLQHPPQEVCHRCGAMTFTTRILAPRGTIHSHTVVHYAAHPSLAQSVPYVVLLVSLDEAPEIRVIGNLADAPPEDAVIGRPVEAVWEERLTDDGVVLKLPQWRLVSDG